MRSPTARLLPAACLLGALLPAVAPARAQTAAPAAPAEAAPAVTVTSSVALVSDYIFRGQTQTWGRPALQFLTEGAHASGVYGGVFISNVSSHWLPGANLETDVYGGWRGRIADTLGVDVGAIYYGYPGGNWRDSVFEGFNAPNRLNTAEAYVALTWAWLTFKTGVTLTEYFGWSTNNSPAGGFVGDLNAGVTGSTRGSHFYELGAAVDVAEGWNLSALAGRQVIRNATGLDVTYYRVGVTRALPGGWSLGLNWWGTNDPAAYRGYVSLDNGRSTRDIARDRFVFSVARSF